MMTTNVGRSQRNINNRNSFEDDFEIPISEVSVAKFEALNSLGGAVHGAHYLAGAPMHHKTHEELQSCMLSGRAEMERPKAEQFGVVAAMHLPCEPAHLPCEAPKSCDENFAEEDDGEEEEEEEEEEEDEEEEEEEEENDAATAPAATAAEAVAATGENAEQTFDFDKYREETFGTDPSDVADGNNSSELSAVMDEEGGISSAGMQELNLKLEVNGFLNGEGKKRWECHLCNKVYSTKHNLMIHVLDHSGVKMHSCHVCRRRFKQHSHLRAHLLIHSNTRPHACSVCSKAFTQVTHLRRHMIAIHGDGKKPHTCQSCGRGFAFPSELKIHIRKMHDRPGSSQCGECNKTCTTPEKLLAHMQRHSRSSLECNVCRREFLYPSQLKDHMKSHSTERPFMCGECGMEFLKEAHLKNHQLTHTGEKPHKCRVCGREFSLKSNMKRHEKIHQNDRQYKCQVCSREFTQLQTLNTHLVKH
ncbi:PREDICTED: zinc finger protein 710-like, partial [Priapulus caudatus]|uniref:Zinc finger protein 710-like n=1 Tax=Priapulus caudatus TaxID=37621 RepID=A0ABM1E822_PRICU